MIYSKWMKYLDDSVPLCSVVMPGAHNAGSFGLGAAACCQDGSFCEQVRYGVRHFCIRLDTDRRGNIILCHGIAKGLPLEPQLAALGRIIEKTKSEFFIFDVREYYSQKFGPVKLTCKADAEAVDALFEKYLDPQKYAFTDFDDIATVTMGDIRRSGKRYLLYNYRKAYRASVDCPYIFPWDKLIFGMRAKDFARESVKFLDWYEAEGLFWLQVQQTPNLGTDIGFVPPRKLDRELRPFFAEMIESIASNPLRLSKANIIAGDFMTEDYMKCREILRLNVLKGNIKKGLEQEFLDGLDG